MADISILSRLQNGFNRNVNIADNTLVVTSIKVGGSVSNTELTKAILDNLVNLQNGSDFSDGTNSHTHDGRYFTETELSSSGVSSGSDLIGDDNTYSNFTPTAATVKGALAGIDAAIATAGGTTFSDATFRIQDDADPTKQIAFEAAAITTGTTRTITQPDANVDLGQVNTSIQQNGSRAFTADQSMGGFKLTNVAAGTLISDATRKDQQILRDGTQAFTAAQSMGGFKLTSLATATLSDDALRKDQAMLLDGTQAMTADMNLGNFKITNLASPTNAGDAASKSYVDGVASGLDLKASVRAATIEILDNNSSISGSPTYNNTGGTSGRGQITATLTTSGVFTVDGVNLASGNRLLIKDEGDVGGLGGAANGIYIVTISGTSLTLDRSTDFDQDAEVQNGAFMFVREGTVNADTGWVLITDDPITIGGASGTALDFTQFSGAGTFSAGDGLVLNGTTFDVVAGDTSLTVNADDIVVNLDAAGAISLDGGGDGLQVNVDNIGIEIATNALQLKDAGVTTAKLANDSVTAAKLNADTAGSGLVQNGTTGALDVNADGTSLEVVTDTLQVKDAGITPAKLAASVAGNGLVGGAGAALDVNVDDSTLAIVTDTVLIKDVGVTAAKLNTNVADQSTITGGAGTALAVQRSPNVTQTVIAGESMAANTTFAVRWAVDGEVAGRVYKATNDASTSDLFYVVGLVKSSVLVNAGDTVAMIKIGEHTLEAGEAFGATDIGKPVFLNTAGALTITAPSTANTAVVRVGMLKNTTLVDTMPVPVGVN